MNAHLSRSFTVENVGGLDGAVFGKGVGKVFNVLALF